MTRTRLPNKGAEVNMMPRTRPRSPRKRAGTSAKLRCRPWVSGLRELAEDAFFCDYVVAVDQKFGNLARHVSRTNKEHPLK